MTDPLTIAAVAGFAAMLCWRFNLSPSERGQRACRNHHIRDRELPFHNPNLCEDCLEDGFPNGEFYLSNTGICGKCHQTNDVWDLEHLETLFADGLIVKTEYGLKALGNPVRNTYSPGTPGSSAARLRRLAADFDREQEVVPVA